MNNQIVSAIREVPLKIAAAANELDIQAQALQVEALEQVANNLVIVSAEGEAHAADLSTKAKELSAPVEALRKKLVEPANGYVKTVNAICKAVTERADAIIVALRKKAVEYRQTEDRRLQAELDQQNKARLEAERNRSSAPSSAPVTLPPVVTTVPNVSTGKTATAVGKQIKRWRVTDENAIPDTYWMLNEDMINAAVKTGTEIPGVEVYYEQDVTFRKR